MMDDYANRQADHERDYLASFDGPDYLRWVDSLSAEERQHAESLGLLKPMIDRSGSTSRAEDAAELSTASEMPDFAAAIDGESAIPSTAGSENADDKILDLLRRLIAEILSQGNARLTLECLALACGLGTLQGESMTSIAKRHGLSRAAVSKRCVDITEKLNLPPSRSMRSKKARKAYRKAQIQIRTIYERIGYCE
ncbi:MAG: hypothetical protein ACFUZC_17065 [Chthoniobacteraceae bacterium]